MHLTIVKDDNFVIIDGEGHPVDCSTLPADVHALQWDGASGEVEYRATECGHCSVRSKKPNERVTDLSPYQPYVDAWRAAKAKADAEAAHVAGPEH